MKLNFQPQKLLKCLRTSKPRDVGGSCRWQSFWRRENQRKEVMTSLLCGEFLLLHFLSMSCSWNTCAAVSSGPLFWGQNKTKRKYIEKSKGEKLEKLRPEKYVTQIKRERSREEWKPSSTIVTTTNIQGDFTFQCLTFDSLKWQTTEANFIWKCRNFTEKHNTGWWTQYSEPVYCRRKCNR